MDERSEDDCEDGVEGDDDSDGARSDDDDNGFNFLLPREGEGLAGFVLPEKSVVCLGSALG